MNSPRLTFRAILLAVSLAGAAHSALAADSPELAEARTRLLEAFQNGQTDNDNQVKQLRAKISALEYVASAKASASAEAGSRLLSVDFAGGPASALLDKIAKANPDVGFNVIGEKADLAIELPPFSIRNADAQSLAMALGELLKARGHILISTGRFNPGQAPVFTLRKLMPYEMAIDNRALPQFQSFQLAPYLESQSVDDIVGAIRAAWELDASQKPDALRIKFHPPTGILLVSCQQQGIHIVQTVLNQLRRIPEPTPKGGPASSNPVPASPKR